MAVEKLVEYAADIVREAARSPLGLLALLVIAVSLISLAFFHSSSDIIKVPIFLALLSAAAFFGAKVFQLATKRESDSVPATPDTLSGANSLEDSSVDTSFPDLEIFVGVANNDLPIAAEAIVIEQDRDLLLETESFLNEPEESIKALLEDAKTAKVRDPGTVLVRGHSTPYYFLGYIRDSQRVE